MILLLLISLWYITKVYYTRSFRLKIEKSKLYQTRCFSCGHPVYIAPENLRSMNYCMDCI
jgi:uncharacterized OB-fold protein